ncbi:hypothetical protein C7121_01560 [Paenibacillus glucanolyticus]|jgi:hypothetical protein|uniref:hypothetical protein n=1 Tax=Paenibacillus TaxID=44249 RepID=UPI0003E2636C|nr:MULTISPECIES: hypothetical protein [Paenibacillus]ANA81008.1 hypothetical protein A3958_13945 [Paenibacillus glucanolyticus]AVV54920.1 hypothetical protein C7121_01560 [Paenibacillus glucanolyticus]ETT36432.1 hypothetical protein C169_14409 [Paenibacillus sp. FSL R5-808]MPY18849.1 hypothetical protein [Paenibacillus glucanolyticus]OMF70944.1 hypothetical protein BK142_22825 [Paenibacillus glucanolyticus]
MSKSKKSAIAAILALILSIQTGVIASAAPASEPLADSSAASSKPTAFGNAVYNKANKLLKDSDVAYAKSYITKHIGSVTKYQATMLVLKLENAMNDALPAKTDKVYTIGIQDKLMNLYKYGEPINTTISKTKDETLRKVLINLRDSGYRLYTTEGVIFPIIDYKTLEPYKPYINKDVQAYIDIMVVESEKPAVSDAALVISWSEVIDRGLSLEAFLTAYPKSNRAADMKLKLRFTELSLFYGYNNTPLIRYEDNLLDPEVRQAFDKALKNSDAVSKSALLKKLKAWSDVLESNKDKLTQEVEHYRAKAVPVVD